jgi:hypothetical protein|nr:hypothetical protein Potri.00MG000022 [Populus trichocarpa]UZA66037.1 hypothetical protein Podel.00MG000022 [Populus deltoides]
MAERSPPFIPLFMALLICVSCHHCSPGLFLFCTSAFLILGYLRSSLCVAAICWFFAISWFMFYLLFFFYYVLVPYSFRRYPYLSACNIFPCFSLLALGRFSFPAFFTIYSGKVAFSGQKILFWDAHLLRAGYLLAILLLYAISSCVRVCFLLRLIHTLFFCKLRGGELGNRIELIRQSKKEENAIDIESIVSKKAK